MKNQRKLVMWHKLMIKVLKILPMLIALLYFINTILGYYGINMDIISLLSGVSILPLLFLYIASYALGFCNYHRMFLHYVAVSDFMLWIITFSEISISIYNTFFLLMVIAGIPLFIILYQWLKSV